MSKNLKEKVLWEDVLTQGDTEPYGHVPIDKIYKAMDEYAVHIAKGFSIWLNENRWLTYEKDKNKWFHTFEHGTFISNQSYNKLYVKTTEELYYLYLKSINE